MSQTNDHSVVRKLNLLLKEVKLVEDTCEQTKRTRNQTTFQQKKAELYDQIKAIKKEIESVRNMETGVGETKEGIKMKLDIETQLEIAHQLYEQLEQSYEDDIKNFEHQQQQKMAGPLTQSELDQRKEILSLLKQELDYTEYDFKPKKPKSEGYELARISRERRRRQREAGTLSQDPIPLTERQKEFIEESIEKDRLLDKKLKEISNGVKQIGDMAAEINHEFAKQDAAYHAMDRKADKVNDKINSGSGHIEKLMQG